MILYANQTDMLKAVIAGCTTPGLSPDVRIEAFKALREFPPSAEKYEVLFDWVLQQLDVLASYTYIRSWGAVERAVLDAARDGNLVVYAITEEQKMARGDFIEEMIKHKTPVSLLAAILCCFNSGTKGDIKYIEQIATAYGNNKKAKVYDLSERIAQQLDYGSIENLFARMVASRVKGSISANTIKRWYKTDNDLLHRAAIAALGTSYPLWVSVGGKGTENDGVKKIDKLIQLGEYPAWFSCAPNTSVPYDAIQYWLDKIESILSSEKCLTGTSYNQDPDESDIYLSGEELALKYLCAILCSTAKNTSRVSRHTIANKTFGRTEEEVINTLQRTIKACSRMLVVMKIGDKITCKLAEKFYGMNPMEVFVDQLLITDTTIEQWAYSNDPMLRTAAVYACAERTLSDRLAAWLLDEYFSDVQTPLGKHVKRVLFANDFKRKTVYPPKYAESALETAIERAAAQSEDRNSLEEKINAILSTDSYAEKPGLRPDGEHVEEKVVRPPQLSFPCIEKWLKSDDNLLVNVALTSLKNAANRGQSIPENIISILASPEFFPEHMRANVAATLETIIDFKLNTCSELRNINISTPSASDMTGRILFRGSGLDAIGRALQQNDEYIQAEAIAALRPYKVPYDIFKDAVDRMDLSPKMAKAVMTACMDVRFKVTPPSQLLQSLPEDRP